MSRGRFVVRGRGAGHFSAKIRPVSPFKPNNPGLYGFLHSPRPRGLIFPLATVYSAHWS